MSQVDLVAVQDLLRIRHLHGPSMQTTSTPSLEDVPKLPQLVIAVQLVALSASCHDSATRLNTNLNGMATWQRHHGVEHLHLPTAPLEGVSHRLVESNCARQEGKP